MNRPPIMSHISPSRLRVINYLNGVVWMLIFSLVFQLVGGFTPGWLYLTSVEDITVHMNLWYTVVCVLGVCASTPTTGDLSFGTFQTSISLNQYRIETVSAIVFCFFAVFMLRLSRNRLHNPSSPNIRVTLSIGGILALASGVLSIVAAGKFGDLVLKANSAIVLTGVHSPYNFPYSLFITCVGGGQAVLACIRFLVSQPWMISAESQQPPVQANQNALYPAQVTTVHSEYQQPQMYAMSAPTEKGPSAPLSGY